MSTLFVCKGNVGRSQMAEALYSKYFDDEVFSVGTVVGENEGIKIKDIPMGEPVIRLMKKEGVDVSEKYRKQITEDIIKNFERIIVMAERETIPPYLLENSKVIYWEVENPKGMDDAGHERVIEKIKKLLSELSL